MRIFVTAGNTQTPIDRVRCITNIFTGRTGASLALEAYRRGHHVTLATSHPETLGAAPAPGERWQCHVYRTFEDLEALMSQTISRDGPDAVIHCAAVNDYASTGVYAPVPPARFDDHTQTWSAPAEMTFRTGGKLKSDVPELWVRLTRLPKLVDKIRAEWHFRGILVKFKLEVEVSEQNLQLLAEQARQQSHADWMVANTLEGRADWALVGNAVGYEKILRPDLAAAVLDRIEKEAPRG